MKRIAVFDIDGTILRRVSTERMFFKYLLRKGEIGLFAGFNFISGFLKDCGKNWLYATKGNKWYLKGMDCERIKSLGIDFFNSVVKKKISDIAVDMINRHKEEGCEIILLSGAFDFFMDEYLKYLKADRVHGTALEVEDGKFTGRIKGLFPYGENKAKIIDKDFVDIDYVNSYAYANDYDDRHFLKMFGHAVAVNPDRRLLKFARQNNLRVLYS